MTKKKIANKENSKGQEEEQYSVVFTTLIIEPIIIDIFSSSSIPINLLGDFGSI